MIKFTRLTLALLNMLKLIPQLVIGQKIAKHVLASFQWLVLSSRIMILSNLNSCITDYHHYYIRCRSLLAWKRPASAVKPRLSAEFGRAFFRSKGHKITLVIQIVFYFK